MKRFFSDSFVNKKIASIDALHKKNSNSIVTPECLMSIPDYQRKQIKEYYRQLQEISYVSGFWIGWCLRDHCKKI